TTLFGLLTGRMEEFGRYAAQEGVSWLLDVAHGICDPRLARGTLWAHDAQHDTWQQVVPFDPLVAASYLYWLPEFPLVRLTKICNRDRKSRTSKAGLGPTMRAHVMRRDGLCWVSRVSLVSATLSHICPKRIGDALAARVLADFCPGGANMTGPGPGRVSILDPIFGIVLSNVLDVFFSKLKLVFQNLYECHDFYEPEAKEISTTFGSFPAWNPMASALPPLHGYPASPPHPQAESLPPPGLFRWHYIQ
ncbi:hypothetical protein AURDEDRAFT_42168, partial [Auricularia subglabra TFB-10046 SS5]